MLRNVFATLRPYLFLNIYDGEIIVDHLDCPYIVKSYSIFPCCPHEMACGTARKLSIGQYGELIGC